MNALGYRVAVAVLCTICCFFMTGCWGQVELDKMSLVLGMGVDTDDTGNTTVAVAVVNSPLMRNSQGGGPTTTGPGFVVHTSSARTFEDAMFRFLEKPYRQQILSHNEVIVFGEGYAKKGIADVIDYIDRTPQMRKDQLLFVVKGQARELGSTKLGVEKLTSRALEELVRHNNLSSATFQSSELHVLNLALSPSRTFVLPLLKVIDNELTLGGNAVFNENKMIREVDMSESRGLFWWINQSEGAVLTIPDESVQRNSSIRILDTATTVRPTYRNGQLFIQVTVHGTGELHRVDPEIVVSKQYMKDAQKQVSKVIQRHMNDALLLFQASGVDALQIGTRLYEQHPRSWTAVKKNWPYIFSHAKAIYDVRINVIRTGLAHNAPLSRHSIEQIPGGVAQPRRNS